MNSGVATTTGPRRVGFLVALGLILVTSIGCSGDEPAAAAKAWLDAIAANDGNKIGSLTCASQQGNTQLGMGILTAVNWLGSGLLGAAAQIDTSDVQFKTIGQSADSATVLASGQLRAAIGGLWQTQELNSVLTMVVEDGRWKYCGST